MAKISFSGPCVSVGRFVGRKGMLLLVLAGLAGCSTAPKTIYPNRQNLTLVRPSDEAQLLPDAESIRHQYPAAPKPNRPDSQREHESIPNMSYEDNTLDDNLGGSIELADYYAMVLKTDWQRWLQAAGPYTVLAMPNEQMEALSRTWPGGGMLDPANHQRLSYFIGQSILLGNWSHERLKKALSSPAAQRVGGQGRTRTLTGEMVILRLLPGDVIQMTGPEGTVRLRGEGYPQSNGIFYVTDRELQ